jgi:hypothetical protein
VVEQHQGRGGAVFETEVVPHHQDHVDVVRLGDSRHVAPEDNQAVEGAGRHRQLVNPAQAIGHCRPSWRPRTEARDDVRQGRLVSALREVAELVELGQCHAEFR